MTVQELIDELMQIEDKTLPVWNRHSDGEIGDPYDDPVLEVFQGGDLIAHRPQNEWAVIISSYKE